MHEIKAVIILGNLKSQEIGEGDKILYLKMLKEINTVRVISIISSNDHLINIKWKHENAKIRLPKKERIFMRI